MGLIVTAAESPKHRASVGVARRVENQGDRHDSRGGVIAFRSNEYESRRRPTSRDRILSNAIPPGRRP